MKRAGECSHCGDCCQSLNITAVLSHALKQHRTVKELEFYYEYHNVKVINIDYSKDFLHLEVPIPCRQLDSNNRCLVHDQPEIKPLLCHLYPVDSIDSENCGFRFEQNGISHSNI